MSTKIEFAVQMSCQSCEQAVKKSLEGVDGIKNIDIDLKKGTVVVDTILSTTDVLNKIESSGRKVVVKGFAGSLAGVAILEIGSIEIKGVVRFIQIDTDTCIIDGTVDGLNPGNHGLFVHESGDISDGCNSVGNCYLINDATSSNANNRQYGYLGTIVAENDGRANFKIQDNVLKLSSIIGRSLVITEKPGDNGSEVGKRLVCGIIARSSGLFQNPKTICACDGFSIWDERNKPKATL